MNEIKANSRTNLIKKKELEVPDWEENTVTGCDPISYYRAACTSRRITRDPRSSQKTTTIARRL